MDDARDFFDGLEHADFVVGHDDAGEECFVVDGVGEGVKVDDAVGVDGHANDGVAFLVHVGACCGDGLVLDGADDEFSFGGAAVAVADASDKGVDGLGGAGGEVDLFGDDAEGGGDVGPTHFHVVPG